jgi:hypothetical protein
MRSGLLETLSRTLPPGMLLRMIRLDEVVQTAWGEQQPSVALATHPGAGAWAEQGGESGRVESFVCLLQLSESLLGVTQPPRPDGGEGAGGGEGAEGAGVEGGDGPSDLSGVRFLRAAERLVTLLGWGERAAMTKATWPKRAEEMDRLARELDDVGLRVSGGEAFQRPSTRFLVLSLACPVQSLRKHPELFGANLRLDVAKATVGHPKTVISHARGKTHVPCPEGRVPDTAPDALGSRPRPPRRAWTRSTCGSSRSPTAARMPSWSSTPMATAWRWVPRRARR